VDGSVAVIPSAIFSLRTLNFIEKSSFFGKLAGAGLPLAAQVD
jgi:hypothetical protein